MAYVIAARLGFLVAFVAEQVTTVWAPTGIAAAALLLWGLSLWPAIWLGAFVANAGTHAPLWTAAGLATGNTLEAVATAWTLSRLAGFDPALRRTRDVMAFAAIAAAASTTISATIGVTTLCVAQVQPWTRFTDLWLDWWLGDALGALVVAPAILTTARTLAHRTRREWFETGLLVMGTVVVTHILFGEVFGPKVGHHPLEYITFLFVIAAAVRSGQPATALVVLSASAVTIWHTVHGAGPFATTEVHQSLILLQVFTSALAVTGLLLAAAIGERTTGERRRAAAYAVGEVLAETSSLHHAAPGILRALCENLGWQFGALWLVEHDVQEVRCHAVWDDGSPSTAAFTNATKERRFTRGVGLPGRVWATRTAAWIEDVVDDGNFPRAAVAGTAGFHGGFAFPIYLSEDVLGVVECFNRSVVTPDADLLTTMSAVGSQIGQFMARKRVETVASEGQRRTRAILDTALDAIIGMDHRGIITEFNPAAVRMFGYSRNHAVGHDLADLLVPPMLRDRHRDGLKRFLAMGHGAFIDRRVETTALHADGGEFPVEVSISRVLDEGPPTFTGFVRDLTARALAERERAQLLERELTARREADEAAAQLDRILSAVGEGFVTVDREYRYLYVNEAAERILGLRKADLLGRTPWEVFPSEAVAESLRPLEEAVATSRVVRYETYVKDWDRWFENRAHPSSNGVSVFFSDITDRKRAEASLRHSEETHRLLVSLHDALRSLRNPEQVMWECVTRVGHHFGVSRCTYGEIDTAQVSVTVRCDYTDGVATIAGTHRLDNLGPAIIRQLKAGRTVAIDDVLVDPRTNGEGPRVAFEGIETRSLVCVPLVKDARFVALLVIHHEEARRWSADDIALLEQVAERTWFAVENARGETALREHRDVLALAMRGGRMGAWSQNLSTNAMWWSRELEELFGIEPGGFEGTEEGFFAFVHPYDRQAIADAVADAIRFQRDYVVEFRFKHANGEWRWMDGRGRAVYGADDRPLTLYGLGIDITERKRTEQALAVARDTAEAANRLKDQFLATLSHELRTPLNAILGYARMLRTNVIPAEKRDRAVEIIERNAVAQNQLVEDLLDISRITTGKVRLDTEPLPIARPLQEAIESVRPAAEAKRIALEVDLDPFAGTVRADVTRLQQVFWNLLSNAVKFTGEGGRVSVTLERNNGALRTVISDTGIGIAPEFLPYVFAPFRQADGRFSRLHGGLGLGLAICKQLVELHGGTITAASGGPGCGATFTVLLPQYASASHELVAHRGRADDTRAASPEYARDEPVAPLQGLDVLVVDDEADALELFRQVLENAGATVRTVTNGRDALKEFDTRPPDLLVTDLGLPGMDGYDVLHQVRARQPKDGGLVPAVAVTAYARLDDRTKSLAAGFNAHIAKPIDPNTFVTALIAAREQRA